MAGVVSKGCSRCKQTLSADRFSPDRRADSGLQSACKSCCAAAQQRRRELDPVAAREEFKAYCNANPDKVKQWSIRAREKNSEKIKAKAKDYYRRNRERMIAWVTQNRKENPERLREWARGWQARRRALKKGGVSPAEMRQWMKAQKKACHWCGKPCAKRYQVDHIFPLSKGGEHELRNLCIACPNCNLRKSAKDPIDFAREIGKLL